MNKERAAAYLGQGVGQSQVAAIMGVSPGFLSQCMKDENFLLLVEKHRLKVDGSPEAEEESLVAKAMGLQHQLMKSIGEALPNAELPALVNALDKISQVSDRIAQRKMPAGIGTNKGVTNIVTVQLTLPQHALQDTRPVIQLNERSEVVSIDSKPMSPMSSAGVEALFRAKKKTAEEVLIESSVKETEEALKEL